MKKRRTERNRDRTEQRVRSEKPGLTVAALCAEAAVFAGRESKHPDPSLYGVTDGKAIGTYFEHKFREHLEERYVWELGSSAKGIDFPSIDVDLKVTSIKQPQSSCPFRSARQKVFGLGYSLLVFVYDKKDDPKTATGLLNVLHTIFVEKNRTGDYQITTGIRKILENHGNEDDLVAFMVEKHLPLDDIEANNIAEALMKKPPEVGYLTVSNALQWRLQYKRVIQQAGLVNGIVRVR